MYSFVGNIMVSYAGLNYYEIGSRLLLITHVRRWFWY